MIEREMKDILLKRAKEYPVVTITGPRQSGKTTLVKSAFPKHTYVNLEDPETRELAESDYRRFISMFPPPVIIDEIQRVPRLASAIQVAVDANRNAKGQFILTGSHQPNLKQTVSQSLAGRSAFLKLLPLTFAELRHCLPKQKMSVDECILRGAMPELAAGQIAPTTYYRNYIQSYLDRDVRQVGNIRQTSAFNRFLALLAGRTAQLLNLNALSGEVGVSHTTLSGWLDMLEASFIVFRLQPFFRLPVPTGEIRRWPALLEDKSLELVNVVRIDSDRVYKIVFDLILEGFSVLASQESNALTEIVILGLAGTVSLFVRSGAGSSAE